jgi:hypothetical protein
LSLAIAGEVFIVPERKFFRHLLTMDMRFISVVQRVGEKIRPFGLKILVVSL